MLFVLGRRLRDMCCNDWNGRFKKRIGICLFYIYRRGSCRCLYHTVMLWTPPQIWVLFFRSPA